MPCAVSCGDVHALATYLAIITLCLVVTSAEAQEERPVRPRTGSAAPRLTLLGTQRLDHDAIMKAVRQRFGQETAPSEDALLRAALSDAAAAQGFPFARVDRMEWSWSADSSGREAAVWITEGPRLRTGRVTQTGLTALSAELLQRTMEVRTGEVFREDMLARDLRRIVTALDAAGYPFAEAQVRNIAIRRHDSAGGMHAAGVAVDTVADGTDTTDVFADIEIHVSEGRLFFIDEFTVEGNALTQAEVIVRETRIGEHARYDPETIGDIRRRLERLQFFSRVDDPALYVRDSTGGLLLRVAEGNTNQFDGVVGYQPPRGDEERGLVTGLVNLHLRNLFGTGRSLAARWERATSDISELDLHYLEPWLAGLPLNVAVAFFQRQQDSAYVRRNLTGTLTFLWSSDVQLAAGVTSASVIPAEGNAALASSSTIAGDITLRIDTRDDVYNPRSGITLRNGYSGGRKSAGAAAGGMRSSIQRLELDAEYFLELLPRTVLATALHGRELRGGDLDISDLYRLGGATTLRGYREEQFSGTRLGWTSVELRYSLGRRTFGFAFFDFGYIEQSPDPARNREGFSALRSGYGIGGRLETGLGIIGVSYALGEGDSVTEGKIHFGLINAF